MKIQFLILVLLLCSSVALADDYDSDAVIIVGDDGTEAFLSIQDAINNSDDGDTIVVMPGTYRENIRFNGKRITLTSVNPNDTATVESTIIDGGQNDSVVTFYQNETNETKISGFTITNGKAEKGCGILCWNGASPTIEKCRIVDYYTEINSDNKLGGGIYCEYGNPVIKECYIAGNSALNGGGICCIGDNSKITDCIIEYNYSSSGGGIFCEKGTSTISACVIRGNYVKWYGGGICIFNGGDLSPDDSTQTIINCTVIGNYGYQGGGISCWGQSNAKIRRCPNRSWRF